MYDAFEDSTMPVESGRSQGPSRKSSPLWKRVHFYSSRITLRRLKSNKFQHMAAPWAYTD
jgi:hypothetical protein